MDERSVRATRWILLGTVCIGGACAPPSASELTVSEAAAQRGDQQRMVAQRPLVAAASLIRRGVDNGAYVGYASVVIEEREVVLWWKGELPEPMAVVVGEAGRSAPVRVAPALYSEAELVAAADAVRAKLGPDSPFHAVKLEPDGSGLILGAAPKASFAPDAMRILGEQLGGSVPTRLVLEDPPQLVSKHDDRAPWSGGVSIWNQTAGALCTSGFGVKNGSGVQLLTAAHCGQTNDRWADRQGEFIGTGGSRNANDDVMIIPTGSVSNRIYAGGPDDGTQKTVSGWDRVFIGELLCQAGNSMAERIGRPLCNLKVLNINPSNGEVEADQQNGQDSAIPGDSGGPVYSDQGSHVVAKGTSTWTAGRRFGFHDFTTSNRDFGVTTVGAGTGVRITERHTGKCLDVNGAGTADGTKIQLWSCNGTAAQSFELRDLGSGRFNLVNTNSGKCVDVNASGTANGTRVQLWTCNGTGAQSFTRGATSGGYATFANTNSGRCLDAMDFGTADGTQIQIWDCWADVNQQWLVQ
jgi:hypothetical protein